MTRPILVVLACLSAAGPISAHDDYHPPDMRVWQDAEGLFQIEGSFLQARDGKVQILRHGGGPVWVPLERLGEADRAWVRNRLDGIRRVNGAEPAPAEPPPAARGQEADPTFAVGLVVVLVAAGAALRAGVGRRGAVAAAAIGLGAAALLAAPKDAGPPAARRHFEPFKDKLKLRTDDRYLYVESNGLPDHRMMVGIRAWQQQVPIPQAYTGRNAWRIPLSPTVAEKPVSAKEALFRGAIALAVNGVPIFNPIKNDGRTDTFLAGELDEFGGHCGRADDYHYHVAPVHLEKVVGKGNPIGYALDGYPLYGYADAAGKEPKDLDRFNGRSEKDGYRYYSTRKYPYINGGLRGAVTVKDDQIDPQPRAYSPRPALTPLRWARITGFERDADKKTATVEYEQNGKPGSVTYVATADGYRFTYADATGKTTTETYKVRDDGKRPPPKKKDDRPPKRKDAPPKAAGGLTLTSPAFEPGGRMPAEFTGDGDGVSPPLKWTGAPAGTKCFALHLWHKPRPDGDEVKSYWVVYNIPADVTGLAKNNGGVGKDGYNDKRRTGDDPMKSKGPGPKEYHVTLFALSAEPKFDADKVTRADLLKAVKDITLAQTTLTYTYERKAK